MIPGVPRPCVKCSRLTHYGSRCEECSRAAERVRSRQRGRRHYTTEYVRRAREVRATAEVCWICGKGTDAADPWTADHLIPGDELSPLAAAHRSCNSRRGNRSVDEVIAERDRRG